jgi:CubicO group peptidase (beta-lactamase class C family)
VGAACEGAARPHAQTCWPRTSPPAARAITLRDLLTFRLGRGPIFEPSSHWPNTGSSVLGVLIERASGRPFEAFLRERLFEPLGRRDTGFHVSPRSSKGTAHGGERVLSCASVAR